MSTQFRIARHENISDAIRAGLRKINALACHFFAEKTIWNLHQNTRTIPHKRIGPDCTAMGEIFQHKQAVFHDLMGFFALHMSDKTNSAGVMLIARIVKALGRRNTMCLPCGFSYGTSGCRGSLERSVLYVVRHHMRYRWRQMRHRQFLRLSPWGGAIRYETKRKPFRNYYFDVESLLEKALDDVPIRTSATRRGKLFKRLIPVRPGQDYPSPPTRRTKIPALLRMSKNGI